MGIHARMDAMRSAHPERFVKSEAPTTTAQSEASAKLPHWPDAARGVPNVALRSALFSVSRQPSKPFLQRQLIQVQKGYVILYTGPQLGQADLDMWEAVLHVARAQTLGAEVRFTVSQMLKVLGHSDTGKNRASLKHHLSRLSATALDIQAGRYSYEGSLIDEVRQDSLTRQYIIRLNSGLQRLFASDQYTWLQSNIRQALRGKPLAQWLSGYYASHATPFPITVETLHKLCGSETRDIWKFSQLLRAALKHLVTASQAHGQLLFGAIRGDLVYIERQPSPSQGRHLAKRAGKAKAPFR